MNLLLEHFVIYENFHTNYGIEHMQIKHLWLVLMNLSCLTVCLSNIKFESLDERARLATKRRSGEGITEI